MLLHELHNNRKIVLVSGNLCSGKSHYCAANYPDYKRITVSDIVKSLTNLTTRKDLAKTADYDQQILARLIGEISKYDKVIIDGIRQLSIMQGLQKHFGSQIADIIWLDTPDSVARQRFLARKASKDDLDYETARQSDRELGLEDVEKYIRSKHKVVPH